MGGERCGRGIADDGSQIPPPVDKPSSLLGGGGCGGGDGSSVPPPDVEPSHHVKRPRQNEADDEGLVSRYLEEHIYPSSKMLYDAEIELDAAKEALVAGSESAAANRFGKALNVYRLAYTLYNAACLSFHTTSKP